MNKLKFSYINKDKEKIVENELKSTLKIINKSYFFDDLAFIIKELFICDMFFREFTRYCNSKP